jgi:hypothetical protein
MISTRVSVRDGFRDNIPLAGQGSAWTVRPVSKTTVFGTLGELADYCEKGMRSDGSGGALAGDGARQASTNRIPKSVNST